MIYKWKKGNKKRTMIIRRVLDYPKVYQAFIKIITGGRKKGEAPFVQRYIGDVSEKRILDLGCGTADVLQTIKNEACYVGIDYNNKYITSAKSRFKDRKTCRFYCTDLNAYSEKSNERFDIVMMGGVMHHISDPEVEKAMGSILKLLAPGGVFLSHDPCFSKGMNLMARFLCMLDRGRYVRNVSDYVEMQKRFFENVWYELRTDWLGVIPYSVIVFRNTKE